MNSYNPAHLATDLATWMKARFQPATSAVEGGWEYWIQIDFMSWLNTQAVLDVRREVQIGASRADLFLNYGTGIGVAPLPAFPQCWVEIKAQGAKYPNDTFVADVQADIDKMAAGGAGCKQYMLVALSDATLIKSATFNRASGYSLVYEDPSTGVTVLLKQTV